MNRLFELQLIAPTEAAGSAHAAVREILNTENNLGKITVTTLMGESLGEVHGADDSPIRLIVLDDGLGMSGGRVFSPAILLTRE